VHQGYGKFALVFPEELEAGATYYDGAFFLPSHDLPRKTIKSLPIGTQLAVSAIGDDAFKANRYVVAWPEGGLSFDVVSSRQATIDEMMR
jgi:hypothetical protein